MSIRGCDKVNLDRATDAERDARFHELGWTVYRIPGRLCLSRFNLLDEPDEDEMPDPLTLRLIRAIADRHGLVRGNPPPCVVDEEMQACLRYSA